MEKTWPMREEMNGKVSTSCQGWHFLFIVNMIKVLLTTAALTWRVNNYLSRQAKGENGKNDSTVI